MVGSIYRKVCNPNSIALKFKGKSITYSQMDKIINQYLGYLKKNGLKNGERVVLNCPNSPEFIYSYLSVVKNGSIIVPVNVQLTMEEITYIIKDSEASFMIFYNEVFKKLKASKEEIEDALGVKIIILNDEFFNAISKISDENAVEECTDENSISTFLYTSGTTGKPKAAMLTHKNLVTNAEQSRIAFQGTAIDNYMCVLPMFHVFAFTTCVLNPLLTGSTITILEKFHPKEVLDSFVEEDITVFMGVPTMYVVLLEACKGKVSFPKLRLAVSGGAALPVEVLRNAKAILKLPVVEGYGLTEASPVVCFNPLDGEQKEGSIGLPISYVECKIVDENDNEVPINEVGELVVRGENVMLGYYKQEEQTREALRNGWLHTEDLAKRDEEGYIYIVDRKKDLITVGGVNVYPREVEEIIYKHPKVKEGAVIGIDDKLRGEHVKAFIVLKEDEDCSTKELVKYMKAHLAAYKIPREIEFISELPKNGTGKVLKRMLKIK